MDNCSVIIPVLCTESAQSRRQDEQVSSSDYAILGTQCQVAPLHVSFVLYKNEYQYVQISHSLPRKGWQCLALAYSECQEQADRRSKIENGASEVNWWFPPPRHGPLSFPQVHTGTHGGRFMYFLDEYN